MFGLFKKREKAPSTLEAKLAFLAECGLRLAPPFTVSDLLESWSREEYEEPGFTATLVGLGMTEEREPWRNHCVNAWHFDTECIEDAGSYVRVAERLAEMTQGDLVLSNVRDHVDIDASIANLDFEFRGRAIHLEFTVNDDWVDPAVFAEFSKLLVEVAPEKLYLYHDTGGQDCVIVCATRDQFAAMEKAGILFRSLDS